MTYGIRILMFEEVAEACPSHRPNIMFGDVKLRHSFGVFRFGSTDVDKHCLSVILGNNDRSGFRAVPHTIFDLQAPMSKVAPAEKDCLLLGGSC